MVSLLLAAPGDGTPVEVVRWFGAMQAQDVASGHWSLGVRCPGITESDVLASFERGEIVRTWPMRQTVHMVPASDVTWLLALTGRRSLDQMVRRRQGLDLLPADLARLEAVLQGLLADGQPVTRADVLAGLAADGIPVDGQRGYHALLYASLVGLACIGPQRDGQQTFALVSAWAGPQATPTRDEALTELAFRYFRSHGPTTVRDFAGWSGLTLTDARMAVADNDGRLAPLAVDGQELWCTTDLVDLIRDGDLDAGDVVALPGFDEYMLGFKDRALHGDPGLLERVVPGGNGIFRPTIVVGGRVAATWTRTVRGARVDIAVEPFVDLDGAQRAAAERSLGSYAHFVGRQPRITFP